MFYFWIYDRQIFRWFNCCEHAHIQRNGINCLKWSFLRRKSYTLEILHYESIIMMNSNEFFWKYQRLIRCCPIFLFGVERYFCDGSIDLMLCWNRFVAITGDHKIKWRNQNESIKSRHYANLQSIHTHRQIFATTHTSIQVEWLLSPWNFWVPSPLLRETFLVLFGTARHILRIKPVCQLWPSYLSHFNLFVVIVACFVSMLRIERHISMNNHIIRIFEI